jgi:hypothetical protein
MELAFETSVAEYDIRFSRTVQIKLIAQNPVHDLLSARCIDAASSSASIRSRPQASHTSCNAQLNLTGGILYDNLDCETRTFLPGPSPIMYRRAAKCLILLCVQEID